jgi:hypothetical protein
MIEKNPCASIKGLRTMTMKEYAESLPYEEKLMRFREGRYSFPVPPVTTQFWTEKDWIDFIDAKGMWHYTYAGAD